MERRWKVSKNALTHIWRKHADLIEALGLKSPGELSGALTQIVEKPDEVRCDKVREGVRYYLRRLDGLWINVVVVDTTIKTAYLISLESCKRFGERRWCQRS